MLRKPRVSYCKIAVACTYTKSIPGHVFVGDSYSRHNSQLRGVVQHYFITVLYAGTFRSNLVVAIQPNDPYPTMIANFSNDIRFRLLDRRILGPQVRRIYLPLFFLLVTAHSDDQNMRLGDCTGIASSTRASATMMSTGTIVYIHELLACFYFYNSTRKACIRTTPLLRLLLRIFALRTF